MSVIKLPNKHYVGLVKREESNLPLGFMTVWGTDPAAVKRMATVDEWSNRGYASQIKLTPMTLDNIPMIGFKLGGDIRTTNYGGHDKWRIEDPRGFELEITSGNLAQLIAYGTVEHGEILDECVWAREGSNNVLINVNTQEYKSAIAATKIANSTTSWKNVKIGNSVVLQNGVQGQYLGKFAVMYRLIYGDPARRYNIHYSDKSYSVFFDKNEKIMRLIRSPKLSGILTDDSLNEKDAELTANNLLMDNDVSIEANASFYSNGIVALIGQKTDITPTNAYTYKFLLEPSCDKNPSFSNRGCLVLAETHTKYFGEYREYGRGYMIIRVDKAAIELKNKINMFPRIVVQQYGTGWTRYEEEFDLVDEKDIKSYYKIGVETSTPCGNTITNHL